MRSTAAVPVPGGWPAYGSPPPAAVVVVGLVGDALAATWTAACPRFCPARASTIATPADTPVTVPLPSTRATAVLFEIHWIRAAGSTLPTRSYAVAIKP